MRHILFNESGDAIEEAPKVKRYPNGASVWGYNSEANAPMMEADGYLPYDGAAPLSRLHLVDGAITEDPYIPPARSIYTKLEIRRKLRDAGLEADLDQALATSETFRADWADAQDIDLDDPDMVAAREAGLITEAMVSAVTGGLASPSALPSAGQEEA